MSRGVRGAASCAAAALVALSLLAAAQAQGGNGEASFTSDQAYQGRFAYIQNCGECHGGDLGGQFGPALAGAHSNVPWQTPQAVYSYMTQHMPVGNAGGLSQTQYVDIEAFIMQQNGRRSGHEPLTTHAIAADPLHLDGSREAP